MHNKLNTLLTDEQYILSLVEFTEKKGDDPSANAFAAVIVDSVSGKRLVRCHNRCHLNCDATAHAELLAVRLACRRLKHPNLKGYTLFSTCEPCPMCMGAILWSGLDRVVFGATIEDASQYYPQIYRGAKQLAAESDLPCIVRGPLEREACRNLFKKYTTGPRLEAPKRPRK